MPATSGASARTAPPVSPEPRPPGSGLLGYALVAAAGACWGSQSVVGKLLLQSGLPPAALVSARTACAALLLVAVLWRVAPRLLRVTGGDLGRLALLGLGGMTLSNYCYYLALSLIPVATASLLVYTAPLLVLAASVLLLREPFRRRDLVAAAVTVTGAALVARAYEPATLSGHLGGILAATLTAVGFAFYSLWGSRVSLTLSSWTILTYSLGTAAVLWIFLTPPWTLFLLPMSPAAWAGFASIVLFGTLVPFSLFLAGLSRISASHASVTCTVEPVVAATVAFLVLGETLAWPQLLGGLLVLGGVGILHVR